MHKKHLQQMAVFDGNGSSAAVSTQFLNRHHKSNYHFTAVTHFSAEFMHFFKKWHIAPPPLFIKNMINLG